MRVIKANSKLRSNYSATKSPRHKGEKGIILPHQRGNIPSQKNSMCGLYVYIQELHYNLGVFVSWWLIRNKGRVHHEEGSYC
jgi:hypothetical protein